MLVIKIWKIHVPRSEIEIYSLSRPLAFLCFVFGRNLSRIKRVYKSESVIENLFVPISFNFHFFLLFVLGLLLLSSEG
jgi:hypothetical protein